MNASRKRDDGYEKVQKRQTRTCTNKLRRAAKMTTEETKEWEALEAMFSTIYMLLESQHRAYAGKSEMEKHAARMRTLLRYVQRKVKETAKSTRMKQPSRRRDARL